MGIFWQVSRKEEAPVAERDRAPEDAGSSSERLLGFRASELQEMGCLATSTGHSLETCRARLGAIATARMTPIQSEFDLRRQEPEARLAWIGEERQKLFSLLESGKNHATAQGLELEAARYDALISGLLLEAKAEQPGNALAQEEQLTTRRHALEETNLNGRLERAGRLLQVAQEDRAANRVELERQTTRLEAQSRMRHEQLAEQRRHLAELNAAGVTRHVAGFLIWGSSASLLGAGIAVAQLLQRAMAASEQKKDESSLLLTWLRNVKTPADLAIVFGWFMGMVLGALLVVGAVAWLTRHLLRRHDPSWRPKHESAPAEDDAWSDWLKMFSVTANLGGKGVTDHSLRQLIGVIPVVVAAAAIAFLFVAFGDRSSGNVAFIASQLGPAYVMLSIVTGVLFFTNVLFAKRAQHSPSRLALAVFGVLTVVPPVTLAVTGFSMGQSTRVPVTTVAIAMTLAASGLAFGLIYRGAFVREDYLQREIERTEAMIVSLRIQPTLARVLPYVELSNASSPSRDALRPNVAWAFGPFRIPLPSLRLFREAISLGSGELGADPVDTRAQQVGLSGERLLTYNRYRVERDLLRSAAAQIRDLESAAKDARESLASAHDKWTRQTAALAIEKEQAFLALEGAYYVASAAMGTPAVSFGRSGSDSAITGGSSGVN